MGTKGETSYRIFAVIESGTKSGTVTDSGMRTKGGTCSSIFAVIDSGDLDRPGFVWFV